MPPRLLDADADDEALEWVIGALEAGAVVAIPTDTVYGLAVRPGDPEALAALFTLKRRPAEVAVPVLVGHGDQVRDLAGSLEPAAAQLAGHHWPGPLTLVVPRGPAFQADLGGPPAGAQTVGIRWPNHALVESLCRRAGPLAVTSANLHGAPPATSASAVLDEFAAADGIAAAADGIAAVVDGGVCDGLPSTVLECRGWSVRCLRRGALPWADPVVVADGGEAWDRAWNDLREAP